MNSPKAIEREKATLITPVPYAHLQTKDGAEPGDLVVVSLEQLIEAQKGFDKQIEKAVEEERVRLKDEIQKECQWMKTVEVDGDKFQEGAIHGMDMAIDVLNGNTREKELELLKGSDHKVKEGV